MLTTLSQTYQATHYPIPSPDPIDVLQHVMESRGLTRKDMESYLSSRACPLTLIMICRLSDALNLQADVVVKEYAAKSRVAVAISGAFVQYEPIPTLRT